MEAEKNADLELGPEGRTRSVANIRDADGNDARAGDAPLIPQPGLSLCPLSLHVGQI